MTDFQLKATAIVWLQSRLGIRSHKWQAGSTYDFSIIHRLTGLVFEADNKIMYNETCESGTQLFQRGAILRGINDKFIEDLRYGELAFF